MPAKLSFDALWSFKEMGAIALSPDGRRVAFVMETLDRAKNETRNALWLLYLDEQGRAASAPRQLTSGTKNDTEPVWTPDNHHLLFLSDREGEKNQLWLLDTDGGEARKLTNMLHGVSEAAWSPDGQWIAFTASAYPTDEDDLLTGRKTLDDAAKKKYDDEHTYALRTVTTVNYRLDGRGLYERFSQLFVMPAPAADSMGESDPATIRRLTAFPADHTQPTWTPDSQEISVLCNRAEERDRSYTKDIWLLARETGAERRLTDNTLEIQCYAWSPDGQSVALVAASDYRVEGHHNPLLYRLGREGGTAQTLTDDVDTYADIGAAGDYGFPGPYRPQWSPDGQRIYFLSTEHGRVNVSCLHVAQKTIANITNAEELTYFLAVLPQERGLLLAQEYALSPWELYVLPLPAGSATRPERITALYEAQMQQFVWSEPQRINYQGAHGDEIDGWFVPPVGARAGEKYPLLVTIHGGPQWAYGVGTGMSRFCQYFAALGYGVFYCNPHGSTGYGRAFMREVEDDNCGWDFEDLMRGVDACIERGIADPERLVITGYSYGGQMSMFAVTQTNRFKAAVPRAGISNLVSFVGTSDVGYLTMVESRGYPWEPERAAYYRDRSAMTHITNVTTPTLIIHPENDLRCPIEQSEQFYMALKVIGKAPVAFIRISGAWHGGTPKLSQRIAHWEKIAEWFGRYVEIRAEEYS